PSEEDMQIAAMEILVGPARAGLPRDRAGGLQPRFPDLALLHAIPNGGARSKRTASRMKAQGVLRSMPDLCLPVARASFIGLYIEVKLPGEDPTDEQAAMHERLRDRGHRVDVCRSIEEIIEACVGYLSLPERAA